MKGVKVWQIFEGLVVSEYDFRLFDLRKRQHRLEEWLWAWWSPGDYWSKGSLLCYSRRVLRIRAEFFLRLSVILGFFKGKPNHKQSLIFAFLISSSHLDFNC